MSQSGAGNATSVAHVDAAQRPARMPAFAETRASKIERRPTWIGKLIRHNKGGMKMFFRATLLCCTVGQSSWTLGHPIDHIQGGLDIGLVAAHALCKKNITVFHMHNTIIRVGEPGANFSNILLCC